MAGLAIALAAAAIWLGLGPAGSKPGSRWRPGPRNDVMHDERQGGAVGTRGPDAADVPLLLELGATLLDSGLPVDGVLSALVRDIDPCRGLQPVIRSLELGMPWRRAWEAAPPGLQGIGEALAFAHLTGAATAGLLRAAAEQERGAEARRTEKRAAELGVKLVVPLGICALPAFICLGIVPVVMSLMPHLG